MEFSKKIVLFLFLLGASFLFGQTPGLNYQALILNNAEIEIPGTNVKENQVPLGLEDVTFRFSISNENEIEYIEEQTVTTDASGMVSLIVGEGAPSSATFNDIIWDGKLKYLNVEIDILSNNDGFIFLDAQKILYIPHPNSGNSGVLLVDTINSLTPPYSNGDLVWVENFGTNDNPTLLIYNGTNWIPVSNDYDATNELGLIVVADATNRDTHFTIPIIGDQVWNQACGCIEVYNGTNWISTNTITLNATNGLYKDGNTIKLGGILTEPTTITANSTNTLAIKGLEESTSTEDEIVVLEKDTGILKKRAISSFAGQQQVVVTAVNGQLRFATPIPISNIHKLDVYRNGARISFIMVNATTIELEPQAICYEGDEIRIVQVK